MEFTGYNMLIFYSSLSTIPHSCMRGGEHRRRVGVADREEHQASRIARQLAITVIFSIIGSFQLFNERAFAEHGSR